ncbi:MAG: division/cell wall cluster transcriptional repressor MraZ [Solirubrobacteraceae bacterium]
MAFRGTYQHTLDAKFRLTVPARFRDDFEPGLVAVKGVDPCVELWRPAEFETHVDAATAGLATMSPQMRQTLRLMQGSAYDTNLDKVGRVGLTESLRAHGGLEKDVVLIGVGRCLELWNRERWEQHEAGLAAAVGTFTAVAPHIAPPVAGA